MKELKKNMTFFTAIIVVVLIYKLLFFNIAYAMSPEDNSIVLDYYGQKEFIGKDTYAYRHKLNSPFLSNVHELQDTCVQNLPELEGDYPLNKEKKVTFYELDAMSMEGTVSTEVFNKEIFEARHKAMVELIHEIRQTNVSKPNFLEKVAVVYEQVNDSVVFIYLKATEISKRKMYWTLWEKGKGKYNSYKDFKRTWDSSTGFWSRLEKSVKADIEKEVKTLLGYNELKKQMKKSVKKEVEKALSSRNPFIK